MLKKHFLATIYRLLPYIIYKKIFCFFEIFLLPLYIIIGTRQIFCAKKRVNFFIFRYQKIIFIFLLTVLLFFVIIHHVKIAYGEMSEWFMELVLKTSDTERYRRFESYSLRHFFIRRHTQVGRRGAPAKGVGRELPAREFKSLCLRHRKSIANAMLFLCFQG